MADEGSVDERRDGVGSEREHGRQRDAENVEPDCIQSKPGLRPMPLVPWLVLGFPRRRSFLLDHGLLPAASSRLAGAARGPGSTKRSAVEPW